MTELVKIETHRTEWDGVFTTNSPLPEADSLTIEFKLSYLDEANQIIKQHPSVEIVSFKAEITAKNLITGDISEAFIEFNKHNRRIVARLYIGWYKRVYALDITELVTKLKLQHDSNSLANDGFVAFSPDDFGIDDPVSHFHTLFTGK